MYLSMVLAWPDLRYRTDTKCEKKCWEFVQTEAQQIEAMWNSIFGANAAADEKKNAEQGEKGSGEGDAPDAPPPVSG